MITESKSQTFSPSSITTRSFSRQFSKTQNLKKVDLEIKKPQRKYGHWSDDECQRYCVFLIQNERNFDEQAIRRTYKIFKSMSRFITTRDSDQCRSHHQKLQKKFGTLENIYTVHHYLFERNPALFYSLMEECKAGQIKNNLDSMSDKHDMPDLKTNSMESEKTVECKTHEEVKFVYVERMVQDIREYEKNGYYQMPFFLPPCSQSCYQSYCVNNLSQSNGSKEQGSQL